ncbi:hypothetical protein [Streptomonospora halophila]
MDLRVFSVPGPRAPLRRRVPRSSPRCAGPLLSEITIPGRALRPGVRVCPVQLDEPTRQSIGDVDPDLARRVRERLFRELGDEATLGSGAHFPERFERVLAGQARRWFT